MGYIDLTGQRFGNLTVIGPYSIVKRAWFWLCRCDCGNEVVRRGSSLRYGQCSSCGCKNKENRAANAERVRTFGQSLCWDCIRSAAPPSLQCSWDKALVLPEGAETVDMVGISYSARRVVKCPMYLSEKDKQNARLLEQARREVVMNEVAARSMPSSMRLWRWE